MATVTSTQSTIDANSSARAIIVSWSPLTNVDLDGSIFSQSTFYVDKSIQVLGTFNGATVTLWGSNVPSPGAVGGADWFVLHKTDLTALTFTSSNGFAILDNTVHVAPLVSGAGAGTSLTAHLLCATSARK